jgi:hypothetical protein
VNTPNQPKRKKGRSPSYPGIDLQEALGRARTLYSIERRNPIPVMTALAHWSYKSASGPGAVVLAALKKFGLLDDEGAGPGRHVKLTPLALQIIQDEREESPERDNAIRKAALLPTIHSQLWSEYKGELPSDANLRFKLLRERSFTESGAAEFIPQFRRTIAFANLSEGDSLSEDSGDKTNEERRGGMGGAGTLLKTPPSAHTVQIPISPAEWATLQAPFPLTEAKWRQMLAVLAAMKPALVQDGTDDEAPE